MKKIFGSRAFRCITAAAALILYILWAVWLNRVEIIPLVSYEGRTFERGVVTQILDDNTTSEGMRDGQQRVMVRMTTGERSGEEIEMTSSAGYLFGAPCRVGMKVIVIQSVAGEETVSTVYSQDRELQIYAFALLYLALLIIIGGRQGLKGALGLVFTFFSIIFIYLPLVYRGFPPMMASILICLITTLVTMYLIGGASVKTLTAVLGTMAGVVMAAVMANLFSAVTGLTGWNVSNIESLMDLWYTDEIQVGQLLFAGLLISALGATMDVAMSVSSAMQEIVRQNPTITRTELFRAGMRVGRDMMGTDSNTLILAFAGSSLSVLLLYYAYDLPYMQIINSNNIGIAIMQGLSGSFGVVLCVPLTVLMGSLLIWNSVHTEITDQPSES